jgi:hypothetical protein
MRQVLAFAISATRYFRSTTEGQNPFSPLQRVEPVNEIRRIRSPGVLSSSSRATRRINPKLVFPVPGPARTPIFLAVDEAMSSCGPVRSSSHFTPLEILLQQVPVLSEPRPRRFNFGDLRSYDRPKSVVMVRLKKMGEFMNDDVIAH